MFWSNRLNSVTVKLSYSTAMIRVMRIPTNIFTKKNLNVLFWQIYQYLKLFSLPVLYCTITAVLHYLALQHYCCIVICVASVCNLRVGKTLLMLDNILRTLSHKTDIVKYTWNVSSKNRLWIEIDSRRW